MDKLKLLNMCDFCSKEIETCGANRIPAKELITDQSQLTAPDSTLACDKYESPVDVLKRSFH